MRTVIDASIYPLLHPDNEGKTLQIVEYPDKAVVEDLLPRSAFKREEAKVKTKKPTFILGQFPKAADEKNATHFEQAIRARKEDISIVQVTYTFPR